MELNISQLIAQIVNFLILVFLLQKFLWKRFVAILEERRAKISTEFASIEAAKKEVADLKVQYETSLAKIEETSRQKIQDAIQSGQKMAEEIRQKARAESEKIISDAKQDIQQEVIKVKEELKRSVIDLTLQATERMIQEKLNPQSDKNLVENFLRELETKNEK